MLTLADRLCSCLNTRGIPAHVWGDNKIHVTLSDNVGWVINATVREVNTLIRIVDKVK